MVLITARRMWRHASPHDGDQPAAAFRVNCLPPGPQLGRPRVASLGLPRLFDDPQAPGLGTGAGAGDEPAESQRGLRLVAEAFGHHGCPEGQDRGAVDADRGWCGGHGWGAYRLTGGIGNSRWDAAAPRPGGRLPPLWVES